MKRILTVLVICIFSNVVFMSVSHQDVHGSTDDYLMTENKKDIRVKVISANRKQLKLRLINKGNLDYCFYEKFILKKRVRNKWKKVKFKENVGFCITMIAWKNSNTTVKVKWKKFFGRNLPRGKYKIKYARFYKTFRIK